MSDGAMKRNGYGDTAAARSRALSAQELLRFCNKVEYLSMLLSI
ncbi:hypothetical protein [Lysobacter gummosus]